MTKLRNRLLLDGVLAFCPPYMRIYCWRLGSTQLSFACCDPRIWTVFWSVSLFPQWRKLSGSSRSGACCHHGSRIRGSSALLLLLHIGGVGTVRSSGKVRFLMPLPLHLGVCVTLNALSLQYRSQRVYSNLLSGYCGPHNMSSQIVFPPFPSGWQSPLCIFKRLNVPVCLGTIAPFA